MFSMAKRTQNAKMIYKEDGAEAKVRLQTS